MKSRIHAWTREVGMTDQGVARLLGVSKWTVISWRTDSRQAREPINWRERLIEGLDREITKLREGGEIR
jgi:DNA-binding transcriptional regulator YiaG